MAQYKVPQDVEADDKLLGPFSFRQFVYLLIAAGCIALAVALFQLFPLLAIIPAPVALFFIVLALPLKKDQPMETYLVAVVSYYLKPHNRIWMPGQRESTIDITAPKQVDNNERIRDITGEEATHRLSFLADIVDTGGYAIKGVVGGGSTQVNEELVAEAKAMTDMFETYRFDTLEDTIARDENARHEAVMKEMRDAIARDEAVTYGEVEKERASKADRKEEGGASVGVREEAKVEEKAVQKAVVEKTAEKPQESVKKNEETTQNHSIIELASNPDYSVATIAKEANRIKRKEEGEVFISLH